MMFELDVINNDFVHESETLSSSLFWHLCFAIGLTMSYML